MRIRSITVVGLLIFTTTVTGACDAFAPTQPRSSGASVTHSPVPLPLTGGSDAPVSIEPDASPGPAASDESGSTLGPGDTPDPEDSPEPADPFGPAEATYRTGSATLTVEKHVIALERLAGTGTYFSEFGADVIWTGDDGWYVQLGGAKPSAGPVGIPAYIALDWVHDGQHWTSWDEDGCRVTILEADPGGVRGIATCANMRWVDAIAGALAEEPTPIAGQAPFSAAMTFVARP